VKRFYVFWFFFSAGWGYLMAEPWPAGFAPRSITMALVSLPVAALSLFLLLSFELWRLGPNNKASRPSLSLKPWNMPFGGAVFVLMTFFFAGSWGVLFAMIRDNGQVSEPLHFFLLSAGGLIGVWGVYRVFSSRFAA
jgi:hypothetical protein